VRIEYAAEDFREGKALPGAPVPNYWVKEKLLGEHSPLRNS